MPNVCGQRHHSKAEQSTEAHACGVDAFCLKEGIEYFSNAVILRTSQLNSEMSLFSIHIHAELSDLKGKG